jgi:hypothetical protein
MQPKARIVLIYSPPNHTLIRGLITLLSSYQSPRGLLSIAGKSATSYQFLIVDSEGARDWLYSLFGNCVYLANCDNPDNRDDDGTAANNTHSGTLQPRQLG